MRLGVLATHPVQYQTPLFRALARNVDLRVYYAHRQTAEGQAEAGFGVSFEWDLPLLEGYPHQFLRNVARRPNVFDFRGCDTPEIAEIIAKGQFDAFLVTGWNNRSFWQAMRACWRRGLPLMIRGDSQLQTPRPLALRAMKRVTHRLFVPRFDAYLVVGERARAYYLAYGADPGRMFFVPHCVDNDWFRERAAAASERRAALRSQLRVSSGSTVLLFVGKLIARKRPQDLIQAASTLQRSGRPVHVVFVGAGRSEPQLRELAAREPVPVHFTGFKNQSELPEWYASADLLVLPSGGAETWGLVANEAMACGCPVVVSDAVGCAPDLIEEGLTGASFPVGDVAALASAIDRMLPRLGQVQTRQAIEAKMRVYSIQTAVKGIREALEHLVKGG